MRVVEEYDRHKPVKGWVEILYRKTPLVVRSDNHGCEFPNPNFLHPEDYERVGSYVPTEEFVRTFDFVTLLQGDVSNMWNIPRPIQAYDVLNMCTLDPVGITTLMVAPKAWVDTYRIVEEFRLQTRRDNDVVLVKKFDGHFPSFRYPKFPKT